MADFCLVLAPHANICADRGIKKRRLNWCDMHSSTLSQSARAYTWKIVCCLANGKLWQIRFSITSPVRVFAWREIFWGFLSERCRLPRYNTPPLSYTQVCGESGHHGLHIWHVSCILLELTTLKASCEWKKIEQVKMFELENDIKEQIHHKAVQSIESSIY